MKKNISHQVAKDWVDGPYYDEAEKAMEGQWRDLVWPSIETCNFDCTIDLAAGHGRNTERLRHLAIKIIAVDVNETNIAFLRRRFASEKATNVDFLLTDGVGLAGIADNSVTMLYCFDAMVHFDSDVVRSYIREAARVLAPRGHGFIH
jgi:ubiquinone/menaquinone biosynthesis C-methylase UbiE